jgi:DNA invertase Pin-like site-specific DNA recombinase
VIGQWEREAIGERTAAAMQHKASQGDYIGGTSPYGYALAADSVALVEVESEQAGIADVRALRAIGMSLRKIAEALDRKGLRMPDGRPFAPVQVARIVAG